MATRRVDTDMVMSLIRRREHFPRQCGHTNLNLSGSTIAATLILLIPIAGITSPDRTGCDSRFSCDLRPSMTQQTFTETRPNFMVAAALLSLASASSCSFHPEDRQHYWVPSCAREPRVRSILFTQGSTRPRAR
jgi:hypothetical protein